MDGRLVHYLDGASDQESPGLLVVHGFPSSSYSMRTLAEGMDGRLRVVIPDLPGFGASKPPDCPVSMDFYLEFLARFTAQVGLERFAMVGVSMGANICTRYCLAHPDQVESLVLISPFGLQDQAGLMARIRRWDLLLPLACELVSRRRVERTVRSWIRREELVTPELVDSLWRPFTTPQGRRVVVETARRILGACAMDDYLPRVEQPILVLVAESDPLIDVEAKERLSRLMADGRLQTFEGSGHFLPLEDPRGVRQAILNFLEVEDAP
ncbi:MAG: alpha/beta hydrolase [Spirochaetales bacterium]|nr:alpha/beta hydrolase [Spirochaetales bacterium]